MWQIIVITSNFGIAFGKPWSQWGFVVGRISLPVFGLLIVLHLREPGLSPDRLQARTRCYLNWLLGWALVTQPIYALYFNGGDIWHLNAMATLACGVSLIFLMQSFGWLIVGPAAWLIVTQGAWLDGGAWIPLAQGLAWYWLGKRPASVGFCVLLVSASAFGMNAQVMGYASPAAWVALLATPLLMQISPTLSPPLPRLPRLAFYAFYPLHLAAILAWRML